MQLGSEDKTYINIITGVSYAQGQKKWRSLLRFIMS